MTVMVEKRQGTVGDLGGNHPWDKSLPASVLDGLGDHEGNLDVAGEAAAEVYNNWDNPAWRNAFLMALHTHISNQVDFHRGELDALYNKARESVANSGRRAIVKAYIHDVLNELVEKADHSEEYTRRIHIDPYVREGRQVSGYDRAQQASMAAAMLHSGTQPMADQAWEYLVRDKQSGNVRTVVPGPGKLPKLKHNERVIRSRLLEGSPAAGRTNITDAMDYAAMLGASGAGQGTAGAIADEMYRQGKVAYGPNSWFDRLASASETAHHAHVSSGGVGGLKASIAIATGKMIGKHGPEVSRVLGPHMRRYAYKYRGTTADATQRTPLSITRPVDNKGKVQDKDDYLDQLTLNLAHSQKDGGLNAIPTVAETQAALQSGSTTPSHGYMLDSKGVVQQQAHGYADDHYVPFNLKQLHALNGGSYTRSRAFGGPTTEDISLAMMTGTTGFNVISRNGVYKVRFTERTNKTGRKVGAWAKDTTGNANQLMVRRYARLLDAIKNGKVNDPENEEPTTLNGRGYELALKALQKQFPYFIRSVEFIPANDRSLGNTLEGVKASAGDEDKGYVRPFYLKPTDASHGWHDPVLGGPGRSFDEFDEYRLGRATALKKYSDMLDAKAAADARARAQLEQDAYDRRMAEHRAARQSGTQGQAPTSVNPAIARTAAAAGTQDLGEARSAWDREEHWTGTEVGKLIDAANAVLHHTQDDSATSRAYRDMLREPSSLLLSRLANNSDNQREELISHVTALADDISAHDTHGLHIGNEFLEAAEGPNRGKAAEESVSASTPVLSEEALHKSPEGVTYHRWHTWNNWTRTGRQNLNPKKQELFDVLEKEWNTPETFNGRPIGTKAERYTKGIDPDSGLTEQQEFENAVAEARGVEIPHTPKFDAPVNPLAEEPSEEELQAGEERPKGRTREEIRFRPQDENETDEEYERRSDQAVDDLLRELGGDPDRRREEPPF